RDQGAAARVLHPRLRRSRGGAGHRARTGQGQSRRLLRDPADAVVRAGHPAGRRHRRGRACLERAKAQRAKFQRVCLMSDIAWIEAALTSARPQAMGALLRYFRNLDLAEEAFQDACLRALKAWPEKGPPRDPAAWLILVGRNAGVDQARRRNRQTALPEEAQLSDLEDVEAPLAERLDRAHSRHAILRLMFICCHPALPVTQQIALALRIVCGLTVKEIARAFLVSEAAMEQRITRAKARIAAGDAAFEAPGPAERAERLGVV